MQLVIGYSPEETHPKLVGCYIKGMYHKFQKREPTKDAKRMWKREIKKLENIVNSLNFEINKIKQLDNPPDYEKDRLQKFESRIMGYNKQINHLNSNLELSKVIDTYYVHAKEMLEKGIYNDNFTGD
jgi:hypothetical protein